MKTYINNAKVVSWNIPSLAAGSALSVSYVVTPTRTLVNNTYQAVSSGNATFIGLQAIKTIIPLTITFDAQPISGTLPLTVTFNNSTTGAASNSWYFGDGVEQYQSVDSNNQLPLTTSHTYTRPGVYTVSLMASNGELTKTVTKTHYITADLRSWRTVPTTDPPTIIGDHAMAYDSDREVLVMYGGNGAGWPYQATTWELANNTWVTNPPLKIHQPDGVVLWFMTKA